MLYDRIVEIVLERDGLEVVSDLVRSCSAMEVEDVVDGAEFETVNSLKKREAKIKAARLAFLVL